MKILERSRPKTSVLDFDPRNVRRFLREKLLDHGVKEAYLFGSFAEEKCTPWSDLDLVVILQTDLPFVERGRDFEDLFELGIPIDLLVYTPQEFLQLQVSDSPFWKTFNRQKMKLI
jgi:predicted nucleotidyltransferase